MSGIRLRLRPGAEVRRRVARCAPDPAVLAASASQVRGWLAEGALPTRVLLEAAVDGAPFALVAAPSGEPAWVPAAALAPAGGGAEVLLAAAVDAFGSRAQLGWDAWAPPEDAAWVEIGSDGEEVLFRRWDPIAGAPSGPLLRASALDVVGKEEAPRAAGAPAGSESDAPAGSESDAAAGPEADAPAGEAAAAGPEIEARPIRAAGSDAPSSAWLLARFLRRESDADVPRALPFGGRRAAAAPRRRRDRGGGGARRGRRAGPAGPSRARARASARRDGPARTPRRAGRPRPCGGRGATAAGSPARSRACPRPC
ncbi:hypothetical protein [Sorangium cellulosum]|uniref:hypothetical protein n=1 Tax=Sorangium cellulosum TaxID=56 RepID=UPI00041FEFCF|nr:hypothetical protein [Sorangium cellulosum]